MENFPIESLHQETKPSYWKVGTGLSSMKICLLLLLSFVFDLCPLSWFVFFPPSLLQFLCKPFFPRCHKKGLELFYSSNIYKAGFIYFISEVPKPKKIAWPLVRTTLPLIRKLDVWSRPAAFESGSLVCVSSQSMGPPCTSVWALGKALLYLL